MSNAPVRRVSWSCNGLPKGLALSSTGLLSGKPEEGAEGDYTVPVTVKTNWGEYTKNIYIMVKPSDKIAWNTIEFDGINKNYTFKYPLMYHACSDSFVTVTTVSSNDYPRLIRTITSNNKLNLGASPSALIASSSSYVYNIPGIVTGKGKGSYAYFLGTHVSGKILRLGGNTITTFSNLRHISTKYNNSATTWVAGCYDEINDKVYIFNSDGTMVVLTTPMINSPTPAIEEYIDKAYPGIKTNCAVYGNGRICYILKNDNSDFPSTIGYKDLSDDTAYEGLFDSDYDFLTFHDDTAQFVCFNKDNKHIYGCNDGVSWEQLSEAPLPLKEVTSIAYSQAGGYCAVGYEEDGTAVHSYHSKDLKKWLRKRITDSTDITSVVWSGALQSCFYAKASNTAVLNLWRISANNIF